MRHKWASLAYGCKFMHLSEFRNDEERLFLKHNTSKVDCS